MDREFQDRVALVTGAASGIGEAIARKLSSAGARLVLVDRDCDACAALAARLDASGKTTLAIGADVVNAPDLAQAVDRAVETFGRLDLAVNNAGIAQPKAPVAKLDEADWNRVIAVNLNGVFYSMKYEIAAMLKRGSGAIVNMASALGLIATGYGAAYVASKHGVIGLTKAAALEYAKRNIRINAVAPGVIDTPLVASTLDATARATATAHHPVGRLGQVDEVAELVCFLLSSRAPFMTGAAYPIDGGWTAH